MSAERLSLRGPAIVAVRPVSLRPVSRRLVFWQLLLTTRAARAQTTPGTLPDAPTPRLGAIAASGSVDWRAPAQQSQEPDPSTRPGFPPVSPPAQTKPSGSARQDPGVPAQPSPCLANADMSVAQSSRITCAPDFNPYRRFLDSSGPHPLTVRQKGELAIRNATDPFNALTIVAQSGISVAADPGSPYGPGFPGFGRNVGVAYTETLVSNFFGTFLIPSIAHQDPHYHRMPNATPQRRVLHAVAAVVWAQSDAGTGMVNYANLGNTLIGDALGNVYVPGRQKGFGPGASRFATAIATDPIDNLITEFLPDVAKHVNVQIVLIQRVVNEVERQNGGT